MPAAPPILDAFSALSDPTRCRMLLVLDRHELTVSELGAVVQLPQSTVSRHLKVLGEAGLVASRREGTSRFYARATGEAGAAAQVWALTRAELADRPDVGHDARRLEQVLARRRETAEQFFATAAGQWERLREELFGQTFDREALIGLVDDRWVVGDLGCGAGTVAAALAPHVARVVGVDASEEMLAAARGRVAACPNVELRRGPLEALPLEPASLDAAVLMLVLPYLASPARALAEVARVVRPGGRLLIVDLAPHDREEFRRQMGHVWLGFGEEQIARLAGDAGFTRVRVRLLPPAPRGRGPALFAATAARA